MYALHDFADIRSQRTSKSHKRSLLVVTDLHIPLNCWAINQSL